MTKVIVGTGDHVYEVLHPFGKLPGGMSFGNAAHVATDSKGRVYVYQRKDPPILVFDADGNLLNTWGDGQFLDAHGIYLTLDDELLLVDRDAHEVLKCTTEGEILLRLGNRGKPSYQEPFNHPTDVAVAQNGDIFVSDGYGNFRVHRFSADGRLMKSWGRRGAGPGEFLTPHGIWVDGRNRVYVCDRDNDRVQVFSTEGDFMTEWRHFFHPMDIFMDSRGTFYVTDQVPSITLLNGEGDVLFRSRMLFNGHGIWIDWEENIYSVPGNQTHVTKLVKL